MANDNELWLIRHGETAWSLSGQHTGATDLPLTDRGQQRAARIREFLQGRPFALVLTSPMVRARRTCEIAGYGAQAIVDNDLSEWNYGDYEGLTTAQIQQHAPGWTVWKGPLPGGETIDHVAARARRVIGRAAAADGPTALFAHGHILRILAACWLELAADAGRYFALSTGSVSVLGHEREQRVLLHWNRALEQEG
jgi:broad specificity phosphatase PhoE